MTGPGANELWFSEGPTMHTILSRAASDQWHVIAVAPVDRVAAGRRENAGVPVSNPGRNRPRCWTREQGCVTMRR